MCCKWYKSYTRHNGNNRSTWYTRSTTVRVIFNSLKNELLTHTQENNIDNPWYEWNEFILNNQKIIHSTIIGLVDIGTTLIKQYIDFWLRDYYRDISRKSRIRQ
jgi:hypothetical protein